MTWHPPEHPRDRRGRFTESGASEMTDAERARMNEILSDFAPRQFASADQANDYVADHSGGLLPDEVAAVRTYTHGDTAAGVNRAMRSRSDGEYEDLVETMKAAFRPAPDDLILTRTVSERAFGEALPDLAGVKVRDAAPTSTALGVRFEAADQVHMRIAVPKGTPTIFAGPHSDTPDSREVLLAPGQELGVASTGRQADGNGWGMTAVALGPSLFGDPVTYKPGDEQAFLDRFSGVDRPTDHGQSAHTRIRTDPDTGQKMIYKRTDEWDADQAEAEVLGALVGEAMGAPVPKSWRLSDTAVAMEYVEGKTVGRWLTERGLYEADDQPWFRGADADRLAVMDYIAGNRDRNTGNVMITPDGRLTGIDHGAILANPVFATQGVPLDDDDNMTWGMFGKRPWERPGVSLEMLDEIEPKLAALQPDFDRIGGHGPARHAELMRRTALLRDWLETSY